MGVGFVGGQLHLAPCSGCRFPVRVACGFVLFPAVGGYEAFWVGVGAFHVYDPFAASFRVFGAQTAVGVELAFEVGVDAALEPVGVVGQAVAFEVGEEHAVAMHRDDAEVGAAQPFVGPPPCVSGPCSGVVGVGSGVRAFLDVVAVPVVPVVEGRQPLGRPPGLVDPRQFPDEGEQFPACLASGFSRQIGERVPERVHQAALHRRVRPCPAHGLETGRVAVAHQQIRRRQRPHQRLIGGLVLLMTPLPADRRTDLVDGDQHAPAMGHVRAVDLDEPVDHAVVDDARAHVPAPVDGAQERAPAHADRLCRGLHRDRAGHPAQERAELGHPDAVLASGHAADMACVAPPTLPSRRGLPVLSHRRTAKTAQSRPW